MPHSTVAVAFTLAARGGNRQYRAEWDGLRNELMSTLPPPIGRRDAVREGDRVQDQFVATVRGDEVIGPDGRRLQDSLAELLPAYAEVFGRVLLRHSRRSEPR